MAKDRKKGAGEPAAEPGRQRPEAEPTDAIPAEAVQPVEDVTPIDAPVPETADELQEPEEIEKTEHYAHTAEVSNLPEPSRDGPPRHLQFEDQLADFQRSIDQLVKAHDSKLAEVGNRLQAEVALRQQLEEELARAREQLDLLAQEHAAELTRGEQELQAQIAARRQLEDKLEVLQAELEQLVGDHAARLAAVGAELESQLAQRQRLEEELTAARDRLESSDHLVAAAAAARTVERQVAGERDALEAIQAACAGIIGTGAYENAWIALVNDSEEVVANAAAGPEGLSCPLIRGEEGGQLSTWGRSTIVQPEVVLIHELSHTSVGNGAFAEEQRETAAMAARLAHDGQVQGVLCVTLPGSFAVEEQEQAVLQGIAGSIAAALHWIDRAREYHRVEAELLDQKLFTESIIGSLPGCFYVTDRNGVLVRWNSVLQEMTGRSRQELLEMRFIDLFVEADRQAVADRLEEASLGGRLSFEASIVAGEGDTRLLELTALRVGMGLETYVVGRGLDITERRRTEEWLKLMETAAGASVGPIVTADIEGSITYANTHFVETWSYDNSSQVLGKKLASFFGDEDEAAHLLSAVSEGQAWSGETVARRRDGISFPVRVLAHVVADLKGQPCGLTVSFVDLTVLRQRESDLDRRGREMACLESVNSHMALRSPLQELMPGVLEHLVQGMQYPHAAVAVAEIDGRRFVSRHDVEPVPPGLQVQIRSAGEFRGLLAVYYGQRKSFVLPEELSLLRGVAEAVALRLERETAEDRLGKSQQHIDSRNQVAAAFATAPDRRAYAEVLGVLLKATGSTHGALGYVGERGDLVYRFVGSDPWREGFTPEKTVVYPKHTSKAYWGRALAPKRAFHTEDGLAMPEGQPRVRRAIAAPLMYKGSAVGFILVANKPEEYDEQDVRLLEAAAGNTTPVLMARLERDRVKRSLDPAARKPQEQGSQSGTS